MLLAKFWKSLSELSCNWSTCSYTAMSSTMVATDSLLRAFGFWSLSAGRGFSSDMLLFSILKSYDCTKIV